MHHNDAIYLTDRTSIETDWECGTKFWWYKHEGGIGMVPSEEAEYFIQGRLVHEDLAKIAAGVPLEDVLAQMGEEPIEQPAREVFTRRKGWMTAFTKWVEPRWEDEFETISIEKELVYEYGPLWIGVVPDRVLRIRKGPNAGKLVYREFKTAKNMGPGWINYWPSAVQLHLGLAAVEQETGEKVAYGQVVGLAKGYEKDGQLYHPYVRAYLDKTGEWTSTYKTGLQPVPVWDYPDGIPAWVERCGETVGLAQFVYSAPIIKNDRLVQLLCEQRLQREIEVQQVKDACQTDDQLRAKFFPHRFSKCRPVVGSPCAYLSACHNGEINKDPLGTGWYVKRTPHHELEIISQLGE